MIKTREERESEAGEGRQGEEKVMRERLSGDGKNRLTAESKVDE